MRSILQNSADPKLWWGNPGLGFLDNVHRQSAGMVQIDDAALATTRITPGKLALGESAAGPQTRRLTLTNSGASAVTYNLSRIDALTTGGATNAAPGSAGTAFVGGTTVAFSSPSVAVPAGGSASVDVTITAPAGPVRGATGFFAYAWDGNKRIETKKKTVLAPQPDGQYRLRVEVLKELGDPANPAHWETWDSPMS